MEELVAESLYEFWVDKEKVMMYDSFVRGLLLTRSGITRNSECFWFFLLYRERRDNTT